MPSSENKRTEISEIGEFKLIERLTQNWEHHNNQHKVAIGDDAAILLPSDKEKVVTTDILVEGIHFDLSYTPLKYLGYKSVVVNLSDVYAMNGRPQQILVSIALSNRFSVEAVEELYKGIQEACNFYKVDLIGGDTTASVRGLIINIVAIGEVDKGKSVLRSGAQEGDLICVSGDLGGAYVGLQLLEREKKISQENPNIKPDWEDKKYILERQLKPEARNDIIDFFEKHQILPTSMMDISDGLSSEILHISQKSDVGAILYEKEIPIAHDTYNAAVNFNIDPTLCALSGGEDYELLFTVSPSEREKINLNRDIAIIGEILPAEMGVKLETKSGNLHDIISLGWDSLKDEN